VIRGARPAIAICAALGLALASSSAWAAELPPLPQDFSAADQYVESPPSGDGGRPSAGKGGAAPLPPGVAGRLGNGSTLERVATSPELGAPNGKLKPDRVQPPSVPSAAVDALDGGKGPSLLWLLVALVAVSALLAGAAVNRHHQRGKAAGGT
jgi:hypothetical protein